MEPTRVPQSKEPELPWTHLLLGLVAVRALVFACGAASYMLASRGELSRFTTDSPLIFWDAVHYLSILREGYPPPSSGWIIAFFPLYPLLARPLVPFIGDVPSLLLVSNTAAIAGLLLMFLWARRLVGDRTASIAALLLACYPPSVFFSSAYTEGPFMLCVAAALWFLGQRRYWAAAAVSGLSTGLRPTGVALAAVVILMALRQTATLPPARRWTTLLGISALSVAGLMAYQGFLMVRYHRVDAYFVAQRDWQPAQQEAAIPKAEVQTNAEGSNSQLTAEHSSSREGPVAGVLRRLTSPGAWNRVLLAGVVGLGVWGLVRPGTLPRELFVLPIFIFLLGWLPGWGARITSIARFETAAIPCFVLLAQVLQTRPAWAWAVLGSTLALQCGVYAVQVARGVWGG